MMKILKWVLIVLAVLILIAIVAAVIFIRQFDINQYKDKITAALSQEIDRPVSIGHISLEFNFDQGFNIGLDDLSIVEKPPLEGKIVSLQRVFLGVDVPSLIKEQKIFIKKIELIKPFLHMVIHADQTTNIGTLVKAGQQDDQKIEGTPAPERERKKTPAMKVSEFSIESIKIVDGYLVVEDQSKEPANSIEITDIDVTINDLTLDKEFPFVVKLSLLSNTQNIDIKGKAAIDQLNKEVAISALESQLALNSFDPKRIESVYPPWKDLGVQGQLTGDVSLQIDRVKFSQAGLGNYSGQMRITDGRLKLASLANPIENIDMLIVAKSPNIDIKDIFMYIGGGQVKGQVHMDEVLTTNRLDLALAISAINLEEIIPQQNINNKLVGKLNGSIKALGEHNALNPIDRSLKAEVRFQVDEGRITDINVLKTVIEKLDFLPNIQQGLQERLPKKYKEMMEQKDTLIEKLTFDAAVVNRELVIEEALMQSSGFHLIPTGKIDLDQNCFLRADLYMAADLTRALLSGQEDLTFLANADGQLHVPFKPYRGPLDKLRLYPDVESLGKQAIQNKGKQELRKAIFKALDLEETQEADVNQPPEDTAPQNGSTTNPPTEETHPEEILIESILDAIFK